MQFEPAIGQTVWKKVSKFRAQRGKRSWRVRVAKCGGDFLIGCEIDKNRLRTFPVGRDLQNCGSAETAMSNKHFLAEVLAGAGGNYFGRDARKIAVPHAIFGVENERNQ